MFNKKVFVFIYVVASACGGTTDGREPLEQIETVSSALTLRIPGLVMGLQHNQNQTRAGTVMYSALASDAVHQEGGDLGASNHRGYEWWSFPDNFVQGAPPPVLPPGVVVALKHNRNQAAQSITAFGRDPVVGTSLPGFSRQIGGDRGAPGGVGYFWYESTGAGFTNWASVDALLPKYAVIGLKHSQNQASKVLVWNGVTYDPVKVSPVPPGFRRASGGDLGASSGVGYYWYEKTTGEEVVSVPSFTRSLGRSIFMGAGDAASADGDQDCLVDQLENTLAAAFPPYVAFDSFELARNGLEPITILRVYSTSPTTLRIRWVFLFGRDGGYGPSSFVCMGTDDHFGDNDTADYDLSSSDGGITWTITKIEIGFKGKSWPLTDRLEVSEKVNPVIYMSGSKHHEYFTRDNDNQDSPYSEPTVLGIPFDPCNDDVDGLGARVLVNTRSIPGFAANNVGEPGAANTGFVNRFPMFGNQSPWDAKFYSVSMADKFPAAAFSACTSRGCSHPICSSGGPLGSSCSSEANRVCGFDPYCCQTAWDNTCISEAGVSCP